MIRPASMNRFTNYIFKNYAKDSGKLLVHVGTGVTVVGASAQVGMLLADKEIDGRTKKFLVNQEIITSGACIALYYSICESVRVGVNKLVDSGKLISKSAKKSAEEFHKFKNGVSVLSVIAASVFAGNIAGPVIGNFLASLPAKYDSKK